MKTGRLTIGLFILFSFPTFAQSGLKGDYFNGTNFEQFAFTRLDKEINFRWDKKPPGKGLTATDYSIRWTGRLQAPENGEYTFSGLVDDGIRFWIGGVKLMDAWGPHDLESVSGEIELEAGKFYDLKIEYFNGILEGEIQLSWQLPSEHSITDWFGDKVHPINIKYLSPPVVVIPKARPIADEKPDPPKIEPKPQPPTPVSKAPINQNRAVQMKDTIAAYTPKNVYFDPGLPFVLETSFPEMDRLVKLLQRFEKLKITIDGHTDITGDPAINLELSQDRANEVAWYLKEHGIAANRIKTRGYGATRPLFGKDSTRLYPQNRRVEFKIE